jgi:hypothetical protein
MKGAFDDKVGNLVFLEYTDDIEDIFKDSLESRWIEEGDEHGSILDYRFYIYGC